MVTGCTTIQLNDAFGRNSRIKKAFCQGKQPCAIAAGNRAQLSIIFKWDHKSEG